MAGFRLIICETCKGFGKEFEVPYDEHGVAIMEQHLKEKHGITTNATELLREQRRARQNP